MWNGGISPVDPTTGMSLDPVALEARQKELAEEGQQVSDQIGDETTRELAIADRDVAQADSERLRTINDKRGLERGLEEEIKRFEEFKNKELKALSDRIGVSEEKLRNAWDLARFYQEYFEWEIKASVNQALIELKVENENAWDEIIRAMHALFLKFSDTIAGTRTSSGSGIPEFKKYFNLKDQPKNRAPERVAEATAQQRDIDTDKWQLQAAAASGKKFHEGRIADAEEKLDAAKVDERKAGDDYDSTEARQERVAAILKEQRAKLTGIQRQLGEMSDLIKKARKTSADEEETPIV